jgi:hypothetical protein
MDRVKVTYTPRPAATPETELSTLAAVYKFVLFDSQARRGDPHDVTNGSTAEMAKNGPQKPQKTERQKT